MKNISIIIVSWNGKILLERFLPAVLGAARFYNSETQIVVVDDGSSDGTDIFLRTYYPNIDLVNLEKNRGFSIAANCGVEASKNNLVVLLNNDVEPKEDFLKFLPLHFDDPEVFAVRIKSIVVEDKKIDTVESWVGGRFKFGFIYGLDEKKYKIKEGLSFTAGGGAVALDKRKFIKLGGFDNVFSPFYWEDVDLSYRAWKRGWKIIYEPRSMLSHYHRSTISKAFSPDYIAFIGERNRYLIVWKNICDQRFLIQHFFFIPMRLARNIFRGKLVLIFAFFSAWGRLNTVLKRRRQEKKEAIRTDREIFTIFKNNINTDKKTFKVLYVDEWSDLHGGGQIYLLDLIKKIDTNKFIPFFICPGRGSFVNVLEKEGFRVKIIKMKRLTNPLNIFSIIVSVIKIIMLIKKEKIDLIHSNAAIRGNIYSGIAAKIIGIPFVWHVHIINSAGWADRILVYLSTKVMVIARVVRKRFSWLHDERKVIVNYNGVDLEKFNPNISRMYIREEFGLGPDRLIVGTVGVLHSQKGQEYFLKAAKYIKEEITNVKFLIVGEDVTERQRYRIKLENLVKTLRLSEDVIFTGWRDDIHRVLAGLDVFVLPSLIDHLPLVVLEAMASAKPVVATNVGGVSEMVEHGTNGILVSPRDIKGMSEAVITLFKDKEKAKRIGVAARKRTEELFNITTNVERVEQIYRDLLDRRP